MEWWSNRVVEWWKMLRHSSTPTPHSFFIGHIASNNSFRPSVLGPQQERAIFCKRFSTAANFARAGANDDLLANSLAMFLPLLRNILEIIGANPLVIRIQFTQDVHGELCP